jgi:hypothetical protein
MLPIRKVVLYKHGVGHFERQGVVDGDASVDLHFKAAEMNDVLKSLTTLDLGEGHVASISYESTKPIEKQLEDISIRLPDENSLTGLLGQLKGARVAVDVAGRRVEGIVTGTEAVTRKEGDVTTWSQRLALLVEGASLQAFDLLEVKSVALLDEGLRKDVGHLLEILISAKKKDLKKLTIFGRGKGRREMMASYTVETPVWKTSYRMLLPAAPAPDAPGGAAAKKPLIQGWALVDNTQDEDWDDVALTLVAGLPISFVHDLYSPRYKRRPVVHVKEEEAYAPPVLEEATGAGADDQMADLPAFPVGAPAPPPRAHAPAPAPAAMRPAALKAVAREEARRRSVSVQTRTVEVGDLFQYEIKNPVTVKRNQSALVPILQCEFEGKRVAVYNAEVREKNPMSAVLFKNTTGMTLEGGPVTVLEGESYVGESMLDTLKPGEERLVPYSVELGCAVSVDHKSERLDVHRAVIAHGTLRLHRHRMERRVYVVNNKTDRLLDLFLEHRFKNGWELVETPKPVESTENFYRFRFEAPARGAGKFVVTERGDDSDAFALTNLARDQVRLWLAAKFIDQKTVETLHAFIEMQENLAALQRRVGQREAEISAIFQNQERVRKNLQALGTTQDERGLRERYVAELGREEDKLAQLRADLAGAQEQKAALETELGAKVSALHFETAL